MATRNYNTETTSPTSTIKATNHSTETTTSPATTLTTTPEFSPIETTTTTNHSTETTTSPATTMTSTASPATTMTSTASPVTTKKPLHISIGVNYRGFIKYANITDISNTLSNTTTKISKYIINVGKLGITSTSSTSTLIDIIVPSSTASPTTTKADVKPTSIPSINVYSDDGKNYDEGKYLTCEASGVVNETIIVKSLSATLSLTYDNTKFEFSSEYDWYYMKNGKKVEVKANDKHEISLSVLHSTSIYIKVTSTTTSPTNTITEPQKSTPAPSNTSTLLTDNTTSYTTT